ncbi:MAG: zf-HC2 domain-containing protein [Acidobacteria bacterium]|nr:zf-HC2 domain-containing protein [Acidobacteriota bacterium]
MKGEAIENLVCEFSEAIVPYLYGESSDAERERFETHMADCLPCTDEFAELSFSRYSVFEWQKEEFAPLKTPRIVIPYEERSEAVIGSFAGFRQLLAFNWSTAVGAAAAIAIIAGIGFVAINNFGRSEQQFAGVDESNNNIQIAKPVSSPVVAAVSPKIDPVITAASSAPDRSVVAVKATAINRRPKQTLTAKSNLPRPVNVDAVNIPPRENRKTPSLTAGTDDDDKSLRLTDLFDTVDTRL